MAHEIDQTTGRAAVFVTGEPAWHRLGTVIEQATTSAEAIGLAGLDWRVEQWPVRAFDPDNNSTEAGIPEFVANVRADTKAVLGVVGKRYRVFQNREAFDFMDALVGDKLAMYETAGSLHGGKRVWMLAAIPKEYRAGSDDLIKPYVLLTNTHDGSQALRMIPTTVRVVCQNTLNLALGLAGAEGLTISHHPRLESRIAEARTKLGIIAARFDQFDNELHVMLSRQLTVGETQEYFKDLAGVSDHVRRKRVLALILHDKVRSEALSIRHDANGTTLHADNAEGFTSAALTKLREKRAELDPLHDKHYVEDDAAYDAIKGLSERKLDSLIDLLTVECVTAHLQRKTALVWRLAEELGVEVRRYWRPDERWLSGYQKIQLAHLISELRGPVFARAAENKKKSELVAELAKLFDDAANARLEDAKLAAKLNEWLPSNLREEPQADAEERASAA